MRRVVLGHFPTGLSPDDDGIWRPAGLDIEVLRHDGRDPLQDGIEATLAAAGWRDADVYLQWVAEYHPIPFDAWQHAAHVAALWGDWNVCGRMMRLLRPALDAALSDHPGVPRLRYLGYERVAPVLPWGWDAAAHPLHSVEAPRDVDVLFVGSRNPAIHTRREQRLARLGRLAGRFDVRIVSDVHGDGYRDLLRRARIVFNHSVRGEANMRMFEAAAAGACVLDEGDNPTLPLIAAPDVHYAAYGEDDLEQVIEALLADDARRLEVAAAGQAWIRGHTYESHLAEALDALIGLVDGAASVAPSPEVLAEQWRLATDPPGWRAAPELLRRHGLRAAARRHEALASDLDAAGELLGGAAAPDAAVQLTFAEAATAAADPIGPAIARGIGDAPMCADLVGVPSVDFGEWRMPLETSVLEAEDDQAAVAAANRWIRLRAGHLASLVTAPSPRPELTLAVLDSAADVPVPLAFVRGSLRAAAGDLDGALADLARVACERPFDQDARRSHALVLALAGRRDQAASQLHDFAASLAAVPGTELLRASVTAEAEELGRRPDTAWAWIGAADGPLVADLLRARAAGTLDAPRLRIVVADQASLNVAAEAGLAALAADGIDPETLPDTEIVVEDDRPLQRWRRLAVAALVVADPDGYDHRLARRLGVPARDVAA